MDYVCDRFFTLFRADGVGDIIVSNDLGGDVSRRGGSPAGFCFLYSTRLLLVHMLTPLTT